MGAYAAGNCIDGLLVPEIPSSHSTGSLKSRDACFVLETSRGTL
jgi:hypothetical protein